MLVVMKFYAIRHGFTEMNKEKRCNGQTVEDHVTASGKEVLREFTRSQAFPKDFDMLISSDLLRTRETAEIVSETLLPVPLLFDIRLREINFGDFTGVPWEELVKKHSDMFMEKYWKNEYDFTPFGGESVYGVKERVFAALSDFAERYEYKKILLVTHGGIIRLLEKEFNGKTFEAIENASVHSFEFDV
jgi:broad specificity phosphatase PhoE